MYVPQKMNVCIVFMLYCKTICLLSLGTGLGRFKGGFRG